MCGIQVQTQLIIAATLSLVLHSGAGLLLGSVVVPANAADSNTPSVRGGLSQGDTEGGTRVFSKDNPLFRQNQRIPNVTPDRSGNTKVNVIVKPALLDRQATVGDGTKETRSHRSARPNSPLDAYRGDQERPLEVDIPTTNFRESSRGATRVSSKVEDRGKTVNHSSVPPPTANPKRESVPGSAQREYSRARQARKIKAVTRLQRSRMTQVQEKRRKFYARSATKRPRRNRSYQRQPYWRRFAPPGTVHSFVRCWPGEPCVRYYHVRRPRTLLQYRRLLAWQRLQDARLRYRRRYGHY